MGTEAVFIALELLRFTKKKRRGICSRRVDELRIEIEAGRVMHPIRINALGDGTYTVKDGRHRIQAHLAAGFTEILAFIENQSKSIKLAIQTILRNLIPARRGFFMKKPLSSRGGADF